MSAPSYPRRVLRSLPSNWLSRDLSTTGCGDNRYDNPPRSPQGEAIRPTLTGLSLLVGQPPAYRVLMVWV